MKLSNWMDLLPAEEMARFGGLASKIYSDEQGEK